MISIVGSAQARPYRHVSHIGYRRPVVAAVVTRPAVTKHISNRFSKKDRLEMAVAYLKGHKTLSVSKYAKMTGLEKTMAKAELDAFALNKNNPIKAVVNGNKKLYVI